MVFMSNPYRLERIHEGYMYVCTQYVLVPVFKVSECTCVHVYLCNLTCLRTLCSRTRVYACATGAHEHQYVCSTRAGMCATFYNLYNLDYV